MSLTTRPLSPGLGVEIQGLDVSEPLDDKTRNEILAEFYEHVALLFRGQNMTVEQQNRFTTTFGDIGKRTVGPRLRKSADDIYTTPVMVVSNIKENGKPLGGRVRQRRRGDGLPPGTPRFTRYLTPSPSFTASRCPTTAVIPW